MSTTKKRKTDTIDIVLDDEHVVTTMIPTKLAAPNDEDPKRVVDVSDLSEEDLKTLKKQDPFLYFSIPVAVVCNTRDIEISALCDSHGNTTSSSCRASCIQQSSDTTKRLSKRAAFCLNVMWICSWRR